MMTCWLLLLALLTLDVQARGIFNLPPQSAIDVLGSVPLEDPACIEGLYFNNVSKKKKKN